MLKSANQTSREIRFDWERQEILELFNKPLIDLMWEAQIIHRKYNKYKVQLSSLFSVKTGGCEEDCSYCSQSIYSSSNIKSHPKFEVEAVLKRAQTAKKEGISTVLLNISIEVKKFSPLYFLHSKIT